MTTTCPRPGCRRALSGGAVQWHCPVHGCIWAADLHREIVYRCHGRRQRR